MTGNDFEETWRSLHADLMAEMTAWRREHPRATFQEIEQAIDSRLAQARAHLLAQVAQASTAADWRTVPPDQQPTCPQCGTRLRPNGTYTRHLQTHGGQALSLERTYGRCPGCGAGFFPPG
jgi:hypothetical protein